MKQINRLKSTNNINLVYDVKNIQKPTIYVEEIKKPKEIFLVFPGSNISINITNDFIDLAPEGLTRTIIDLDLLKRYAEIRNFNLPRCTQLAIINQMT